MNSDEISSLVTKIALSFLTGIATKYGIDGAVVPTLAAGAGALAALLFGVYQHWNMAKVPEKSMVTVPGATAPVVATAIPK